MERRYSTQPPSNLATTLSGSDPPSRTTTTSGGVTKPPPKSCSVQIAVASRHLLPLDVSTRQESKTKRGVPVPPAASTQPIHHHLHLSHGGAPVSPASFLPACALKSGLVGLARRSIFGTLAIRLVSLTSVVQTTSTRAIFAASIAYTGRGQQGNQSPSVRATRNAGPGI